MQEVDPEKVPHLPPELPTVTLKDGTLGGGKQTDEHDVTTFIVTAPKTEGSAFVIVQPSYEDAQGVLNAQNIIIDQGFPEALLSEKAFNALMMIDFCNPVYSWRRGVLSQYVPSKTLLNGTEYDFEANFISAIRTSTFGKETDSPESQFLAFYDSGKQADDYKQIITQYMGIMSDQIKSEKGLLQHLKLAESRRRLYRPLPLDEFGFTLPYATLLSLDAPFLEMMPNGTIQPIPSRGLEFLKSWLDTLWTVDPKLIPQFKGLSVGVEVHGNGEQTLTAKRSGQGSECPVKKKRVSTCPAKRKRSYGRRRPRDSKSAGNPTWNDQVGALFSKPYWVSKSRSVGSAWRNAMLYWSPPEPARLHLDLADPTSVAQNAVTIYQHLRSKAMPITSDPTELWPEEALETLRLWANQGFRRSSEDPVVSKEVIPPPVDPPTTLRVRKDILSLTDVELQTYRARLDDVLQVGKLESKWQELGLLRKHSESACPIALLECPSM